MNHLLPQTDQSSNRISGPLGERVLPWLFLLEAGWDVIYFGVQAYSWRASGPILAESSHVWLEQSIFLLFPASAFIVTAIGLLRDRSWAGYVAVVLVSLVLLFALRSIFVNFVVFSSVSYSAIALARLIVWCLALFVLLRKMRRGARPTICTPVGAGEQIDSNSPRRD
jgi:hypothetical protein